MKAVILDFDGVVADSEIGSARAFSAALSEAGLHTSVEDATNLYVGLIRAEVLHLMADHWGERLPQDMAERVQRHVDRIFCCANRAGTGRDRLSRQRRAPADRHRFVELYPTISAAIFPASDWSSALASMSIAVASM